MSKQFYFALEDTEIWPNLKRSGVSPSSLTFDDVILLQLYSPINSRSEANLSTKFGPWSLNIPVMSAPMDTISSEEMIQALSSLGAIGTLPRGNLKTNLEIAQRLSNQKIPCVYALGLTGDPLSIAQQFIESGAKMLLLDVAHGGMEKLLETASKIKNRFPKTYLIAGNITTFNLAKKYKQAGIDYARVGVGAGGLCTTRLKTGVGFPQLSAIFETRAAGIEVIADGGIRNPADIAKALAAGASMVMLGSMLAGTEESPGPVVNGTKTARGQASASYMQDNGVLMGSFRAEEGIEIQVPIKGPVKNTLSDIEGGLRSAFSYIGAKNLPEFYKKSTFVLVSHAASSEAHPHIKRAIQLS